MKGCDTCAHTMCVACYVVSHWDGCPRSDATHIREIACIVAGVNGRWTGPDVSDWATAVAISHRRTAPTADDRAAATVLMREWTERRRRQVDVLALCAEVFPDAFAATFGSRWVM